MSASGRGQGIQNDRSDFCVLAREVRGDRAAGDRAEVCAQGSQGGGGQKGRATKVGCVSKT